MRFIPIIVLILVSVSFSDTTIQTDWSGGGGVPGPVTDWEKSYDVADQINDIGSSLCLASAEYTVDGFFSRAYSVYATDVDGDGDTDVLGAAYMLNDITWWENTDGTGTSWTKHIVDSDFLCACSVYAEDVDGDGDTDVLGASFGDKEITWWENTDGTGTSWTKHIVDTNFYGALSVYAEDVDGDGDTDVLGAAGGSTDDITWWENTDGTGTSWTEHTVDASFDGANSVYATDVDGDGYMDVLGAAIYADDISWWENVDGSGTTWVKHTVDGDFDDAFSVYAADVDEDGDTDVLGAAAGADDITWWENTDGTGTCWTEHTVDGNFDGAHSVYATDVDGDGDTDVLGASFYSNTISWWDVKCFAAAGALESSILDAGTVGVWELFASNGQEPTGTSVGFQFRSSDYWQSMGAWSDTVFTANTDLSGILADLTDFVQYRVILQTTDPAITPVLNDVAISYTIDLSIGDTNLEEITSWVLAPAANPSFGSFAVHVSVPQSAMVNLLLYDVTGRLIAQYLEALPGGEHSVSFNNLHEGVYFCTMCAGDFTATERIVVLK